MNNTSRRGFISAIAAVTGTSILPHLINASQTNAKPTWDLSWLDNLKGKHKQVFDITETKALRVVGNWFESYREVFDISHEQLSAVVGIAGEAFPINASDELYRKFPIGEHWKVTDPETEKPAMRNIFLSGGKTPAEQRKTVQALQAKGAIFWQCNKALQRISGELAAKVNKSEDEVYNELRSGLNPGVIVIPAHTMLIGLAQEHGCTYEAL